MPLLWLRVALVFYGVGLAYSLLALARRGDFLGRFLVPAASLGLVFHFVSLAEAAVVAGSVIPASIHQSESLLAFLLTGLFLVVFARYRTISPGLFVFPLVFLLTLAATLGQQPPHFTSELMRSGWVFTHIALIFTGYAALFFSFAAGLLYLLKEHRLKAKESPRMLSRLPALEVIDEIGYRSLLLGFPFMTLGLIAGSVVAQSEFGARFLLDPKIVLSVLLWLVYMVLLYTRWNSGWRGRRAAFLSTVAFVTALVVWAANYFSGVHRFNLP